MRHLLIATLFATCALAGPAEDALVQELTARATGNLVQKEKDLPVAAWGDLFESKGSPEATAKAFVEHFGPVLGFPAGAMPGEMVTLDSEKVGPGHTLVMVPSKNRVPFVGAGVTFHFDGSGKLVGVSGRFRSAAAARMGGMDAGAAAKAALAQARKAVPEAYLSTDGTVHEFLQEKDGAIQHVYDVAIGVGADRLPRRVLLGPGGEVLEEGDGGGYFDANGKVFPNYPSLETGDGNLPSIENVASMFSNYKLWGTHVYAEDAVAVSENDRFDYEPFWPIRLPDVDPQTLVSGAFLEVNVYHHLMKAHDRAKEWGVAGLDDRDAMPFDVWMKPAWNKQKKSWEGTKSNANYFKGAFRFAAENPSMKNRKPALDASVIYHEYGHFVHEVLNPKWFVASGDALYEARAIGEGFGDAFSSAVSGQPTVQAAWVGPAGDQAKVRPTDDRSMKYCAIQYRIYDSAVSPKEENPDKIEIHDAGKLFSGICSELKDALGEREYMPRVLAALKICTPASFRKFGHAILGYDMIFDQGRHREKIFKIFNDRGVWGPCN